MYTYVIAQARYVTYRQMDRLTDRLTDRRTKLYGNPLMYTYVIAQARYVTYRRMDRLTEVPSYMVIH